MLLVVAFALWAVASASVVDLTDANFASRIAEGRWFVEGEFLLFPVSSLSSLAFSLFSLRSPLFLGSLCALVRLL